MESVNVLAIDGGGLRGVIPAILLSALQEALGSGPLYRHFDLIAGTSTGGLIAMGLACSVRERPPLDPGDMLAIYMENGAAIFPQHWWNGIRAYLRPKYSAAGLQAVLNRLFGTARLTSACTPLLIASYDLIHQVPFFFKSHRAAGDVAYDWPLVDVGRATSAAPTYLPAYATTGPDGNRYVFVDGGIYVNNPIMAAFAESASLHPGAERINLVAVGTGNADNQIPARRAVRWGLWGWASRIAPVMMDGVSEADDYEARSLCHRSGDHFWRLQPELPPAESGMDDPAALDRLCQIAREYAAGQAGTIAAIAAAVRRRSTDNTATVP